MADWEDKVLWMRRHGVVRAEWDQNTLIKVELGPDPGATSDRKPVQAPVYSPGNRLVKRDDSDE